MPDTNLHYFQVGHGETVTVRVPTHKDGSALFWEFATDSYDIAFGLFFEWTPTDESEVSVHISDSEDEDINDEEEGKEIAINYGLHNVIISKTISLFSTLLSCQL